MKKIAYLFVAFAFFAVISLSSCKTKPANAPAVDSTTVIEQTPAAVDTAATDTSMVR